MSKNTHNDEYSQKTSTIYRKVNRQVLGTKAIIPTSLGIRRRLNIHTHITKQYEDAYNNSPRSRIAKMKASRKTPDPKYPWNCPLSPFEEKKAQKFQIFQKVNNLCEQEKVNTAKLLSRLLYYKKHIDHDISILSEVNNLTTASYNEPIDCFSHILRTKSSSSLARHKENLNRYE